MIPDPDDGQQPSAEWEAGYEQGRAASESGRLREALGLLGDWIGGPLADWIERTPGTESVPEPPPEALRLLATPPAPSDHGACTNCHHAYAEHTGRTLRPHTMPRLPSGLGPPELRPGWCCEHLEDALHTCPCPQFFVAAGQSVPPATPPAHGAGEPTAETLAGWFHEAYERLAAAFGYETRKASAVPWADVPEPNRTLMVAVAADVLARLATPAVPPEETRP